MCGLKDKKKTQRREKDLRYFGPERGKIIKGFSWKN
jgi:hypothetical protein